MTRSLAYYDTKIIMGVKSFVNDKARLEKSVRDKTSSLSLTFVNYGCKKVYKKGPKYYIIRLFYICNL